MELKRSFYICVIVALCFIILSQFSIFTYNSNSSGLSQSQNIINNNNNNNNINNVAANNGDSIEFKTPKPEKTVSFERDELEMRTHHIFYLNKPSTFQLVPRETRAKHKARLKLNKEFDRSLKIVVREEYINESKIIKNMEEEPLYSELKDIPPLSLIQDGLKLKSVEWKQNYTENPLLLPKPILFIHIHKTAGTTMRHILLKNVDMRYYFHQDFQPRIEDVPVVLQSDFLFGHLRYGLHCYFDKYYQINSSTSLQRQVNDRDDKMNPFSYVTILRNPVDRTHSHYYYLKEHPDHPMYKEVKLPFREWIDKNSIADNEECRRMVGIGRFDKLEPDFGQQCLFRLKHSFKFIGITERFNETLVLMSHFLGFQDITYENRNQGKLKNENQLNDIDRALLEKRNKYDLAMYNEALKIFEKQIDLVGREYFVEELRQFQSR